MNDSNKLFYIIYIYMYVYLTVIYSTVMFKRYPYLNIFVFISVTKVIQVYSDVYLVVYQMDICLT